MGDEMHSLRKRFGVPGVLEGLAGFGPVNDAPELFQPLFLAPNAISGAHPSVLIYGDTEKRIQHLSDVENGGQFFDLAIGFCSWLGQPVGLAFGVPLILIGGAGVEETSAAVVGSGSGRQGQPRGRGGRGDSRER